MHPTSPPGIGDSPVSSVFILYFSFRYFFVCAAAFLAQAVYTYLGGEYFWVCIYCAEEPFGSLV